MPLRYGSRDTRPILEAGTLVSHVLSSTRVGKGLAGQIDGLPSADSLLLCFACCDCCDC